MSASEANVDCAWPGEGQCQQHVAGRHHAEIAMHGLHRIEHDRARTGGGEDRARLLRDMQALADTRDHNQPALIQRLLEKINRGDKRCAEGIAGLFHSRDFNVEDLLRARYRFVVGHFFLFLVSCF